jgi:hypothetical protein
MSQGEAAAKPGHSRNVNVKAKMGISLDTIPFILKNDSKLPIGLAVVNARVIIGLVIVMEVSTVGVRCDKGRQKATLALPFCNYSILSVLMARNCSGISINAAVAKAISGLDACSTITLL